MNKARREYIERTEEALRSLIDNNIADLLNDIEEIRGAESDYWENMPENLQDSEKGQASQEARDNLQSAFDDLENIDFESILGYLESARE